METLKALIDIFSVFAAAITPITVALIGYWQVKKDKNDKAYRELREQNEALQLAETKREKEENDAKLKAMQDDIKHVVDQVTELRQEFDIQKIETHLNNLNRINEFTFGYNQSISNLVCGISDVLVSSDSLDPSAREELRKHVKAHKDKETEMFKELYKVIV